MRQLSNARAEESQQRIPSLFSFLLTMKPGVPFSTRKAEIPFLPFDRSTMAMTTVTPATEPCVMKFLLPLIAYPPGPLTAVVSIPPASLPDVGSVSAHAPIIRPEPSSGRNFFRWVSFPNVYRWLQQRLLCAARLRPLEGSTRELSSSM